MKPKILVVDDISANLAILEITLSSLDVDIIIANSCEDAVTIAFENNDIALCLLDVQMPGLGGYGLADLLKADERTKDIPIIFLTGVFKGKQHQVEGYRHGALDYLEKPICKDILLPKVTAVIQLWQQKREIILAKEALNTALKEVEHSQFDLQQQRYALNQHAIVAITDVDGIITYVNKRFTMISGYSEKELIGQNHSILNSGHHLKTCWDSMYTALSQGKNWRQRIKNKSKFNTIFWVDATIVPFFDSDTNKPVKYIAIYTDVTKQVKYEETLLAAKEQSELNAQLKSEFLASMSHEIRTPMNGVLGMLGLLLNTDLTDEQYHQASLAEGSAKSLLSLINDILDFSKVESGKLEIEEMDYNLRSLLGDFAESMSLYAHEKDIEIILDVTKVQESMVSGDPGRLRQILTNIVGNAIKFTHQGEIVITVILEPCKKKLIDNPYDYHLQVKICDTGIGIPEERLEKLFDAFTQADASTTRKYGGTGLGLSIAKKLAELMGGSISVTSHVNQGSCFSFDILLRKSEQSLSEIPDIDMSKLNILVVDDNKTSNKMLQSQLTQWGAKVSSTSKAIKVLELCEQRFTDTEQDNFDIILVDMQMPEMDGAELGKKIRENDLFNGMKMVIMTSMSQRGDAEFFANIGFNAYFPKPVTTSDLLHALSIISTGGEVEEQATPLVTTHYVHSLKHNKSDKDTCVNWPKSSRVLLVEDNKVNQLVAKGIIKNFGLIVDVANNGIEAINQLNTEDVGYYQVILMDCQMPEMDGYQATGEIRRAQAGEIYVDIPIVAMTANAMQGDKEKCLSAGMTDYLSKPVNQVELLEMLKKYLLP